jgi:hypothetical protein
VGAACKLANNRLVKVGLLRAHGYVDSTHSLCPVAAVAAVLFACSNGLPVYNFCVAIDDALMGITHVLRAEEHLPNTLRQVRRMHLEGAEEGGGESSARGGGGVTHVRRAEEQLPNTLRHVKVAVVSVSGKVWGWAACGLLELRIYCTAVLLPEGVRQGVLAAPCNSNPKAPISTLLLCAAACVRGPWLHAPRLWPHEPHPGPRQVQTQQAPRSDKCGGLQGTGGWWWP